MIKKLLPILLLTFVNVIGFTLLFPILPSLAESFAPNQYQGIIYGLLISSYSLLQFFGAPILGSLSDKYGRRPILFLSQAGTTFSWIIFIIALFLPATPLVSGWELPIFIIFLSRIIDGITGGNISVANAWISDMTISDEKTKAFGIVGGIFGFGILFGPLLGGITAGIGPAFVGPAITALIISIITLLFIWFGLPESLSKEERNNELKLNLWDEINLYKQVRSFKNNSYLQGLLSIRFFFALVFASYVVLLSLVMERLYGLNEIGIGIVMGMVGIFSLFNQAVIAPKVSSKFKDIGAIMISIFAIAIGLISLPLIPLNVDIPNIMLENISYLPSNFEAILIFIVNVYVLNLGISLGMPAFKSVLTQNVSEQKQGKITGLDESMLAFGNGTMPLVAGSIFEVISRGVFLVFAFVLIISVLAIISLNYKVREVLNEI